MPKQGQYAKNQRQVHVKTLRRRGNAQAGRTIADSQFNDFVLARFALTSKQHLPALAAESSQRFLQEFLPRLQKSNGNMTMAVRTTLQYCLGHVPWQFFKQVSESWATLAHFCQREIPATPLAKRLLIKQPVDQAQLNQLMAELLGKQAAATTLVNSANKSLQQLMAQRLTQQILIDETIDWKAVRQLLQPFNKSLNTADDPGTQEWINQLSEL